MKCGAIRIGHGIRAIEDLKLIAELVQKGIVLEICPTSNLQTDAIKEVYKVIEELYRKGIKITINTDNNSVSNINIIEEYNKLLENTNLTIEDLRQMNINAIDGAFITPQKRAEYKARIDKENINKNDIQK